MSSVEMFYISRINLIKVEVGYKIPVFVGNI
ncbi:MAG: hypothetical protein ACJAX7_000674 [Saprospiraceae bacterium]|jgi:hypothetical protein